MLDGNSAAELLHDQAPSARADASRWFLADALDDVVERMLVAQKVQGLNLDLPCFLEDQDDLVELVSAAIVSRDWPAFDAEIERRLRRHLQDSEVVAERAEELANEPDEQS